MTDAKSSQSPKDFYSMTQEALRNSFGKLNGCRRALFFSGGFDSMLMAFLMQRYGAQVIAVTVRFDDFNTRTVAEAVALARKMNLSHHILHVTVEEFLFAFDELMSLIDKPIFDLDLAVVYAVFKKYDPKSAGNIFVSGMGSDQWFGDKGFEKEVINEEAHHQVAKAHGYKYLFPFLSEEMRILSQQIPAELKKNKKILRGMLTDDYKGLVLKSTGKREIQVPDQVRRLLVSVYSRGKSTEANDKVLQDLVKHLWLKKGQNQFGTS